MTLIYSTASRDAAGMRYPEKLVGKRFIHVRTGVTYAVTGYTLNTMSDKWAVRYARLSGDGHFEFTRDMDQFLDGRFVEVEDKRLEVAFNVIRDYCADEPHLAGHGFSEGIIDAITEALKKEV